MGSKDNANYPKLALQTTDGLMFVRNDEVLYALADGNYTHVVLTDNRRVKVPRSLKEVDQLLVSDQFLRVHHSHLINLTHIVNYNQDGSEKILMTDGQLIEVSRNRKAVFIERFTRI